MNDGSLLVEEGEPPAGAGHSRTPLPRFDDVPGAGAFGPADAEPAAPVANPLSTLSGQVLDRRYRVAQRLGEGVMTVGIPVGFGVIVLAVVLTGIYVWRANTKFDAMAREVIEEVRK